MRGERNIDPHGAETAALAEIADLSGLRVLELGCGDGRLTFRYAAGARSVLGVDPDGALIREARRQRPASLARSVRFRIAGAEVLEVSPGSFDLAFFSWSL